MLEWMIYAVLVATALSGAALIAERAARHRRTATRWPWMMALVASLLLPVAIATVSIQLPRFLEPAAPAAPLALRDTTSIPLTSAVIDWSGTKSYTSSAQIDSILRDIWLGGSIALVLFLALSTALFHRRKRNWTPGDVCGLPVLVSDRVGPAVVGLIRSRIVVPAWVLKESSEQQRYVMAHEQSHMEARDPLLVAVALALLACMPWNPLLWWQLHRLRCAIEVDCDARVLGDGGDLADYCETLIQVGQNQSEYVGAVTAMSESRSFLERRIGIMLSKPRKWARASAFALITAALGMAAFATQMTPPNAHEPPANGAARMDPALLDAYEGVYKASDLSSITVRRKGNGLTIEPIGQFAAHGVVDVSTLGDSKFLVPGIDATIGFVKGNDNRAEALTVYIRGDLVLTATRVDETTADQIRQSLAARIKNQKPFPDSEKALRLILSNPDNGAGMRPEFAQILARQRTGREQYFAALGPVESYRFEGVTDYGWDSYAVQHRNGTQHVFIQLDKQGVIVDEVMSPDALAQQAAR